MTPDKIRIVLTGGGTGGHVYPCLAIFSILKQKGMVEDALYLGIKGRAEENIVPKHGIRFSPVWSAPVAGQSKLNNIKALFIIFIGMLQAMAAMLKFRPRLVIGTGGYGSAPVICAAYILKPFLGLKIVLEEQNLVPGLLNKVASIMSDLVLLNYKDSNFFVWSSRCVHVGYPVRDQYQEPHAEKALFKDRVGVPRDKFLVLVTGGSFGARSLNRAVAAALPEIAGDPGIFIAHSIGLADQAAYHAMADTKDLLSQSMGSRFDPKTMEARNERGEVFYRGFQYLYDIFDWQKAADLIISRAGAGALAEIMALGKASVIVPKRGLSGDHQEINAIEIAEKNACVPLFEKRDRASGQDVLEPHEFASVVFSLAHAPDRVRDLEKNAAACFFPGFVEAIHNAVLSTLHNKPVPYIFDIQLPKFVRMQILFDNMVAHLDEVTKKTPQDQWSSNLYYQFYEKRLPDFLTSGNYLIQNKGIKLIGALRRRDYYPYLMERFSRFQGYLRRNVLLGFSKAIEYDPLFRQAVAVGLRDPYYEARREAVSLFIRFHEHLAHDEALTGRILELMGKRLESFEVRAKAIEASVLFLSEEEFFNKTHPFLSSRNIRLRQALLAALKLGIVNEKFSGKNNVMTFLKRMLVTTSEFSPNFQIKVDFNEVVQCLTGDKQVR